MSSFWEATKSGSRIRRSESVFFILAGLLDCWITGLVGLLDCWIGWTVGLLERSALGLAYDKLIFRLRNSIASNGPVRIQKSKGEAVSKNPNIQKSNSGANPPIVLQSVP